MAKRLISLSGKVKRLSAEELDADRYQYLSLEQAEPNPGNPDSDNSLFVSNADGSRKFVREPELGGLSFTNAKLPNYDNVVVDGTYALILNNDPNSHDFADSVGYRQLTAAAFTPPTLQTVTTTGNTTDRGIRITDSLDLSTGAGLVISSNQALDISGTSSFSDDLSITSGALLKYSAPALLDNTILTVGSNDSVGQREALFAFVAPTLQNVTDQSIANAGGDAAVTTDGLNAAFFAFGVAPPSRASVDARTALVYTGVDDSIGTRTLTDLAVSNTTSSAIQVNNNFTANKLYVQDPSTFTLPVSGTIPLVVYTDDSEYAIVDIDVENLDANFETLQSVTARQAPGLDLGETTNEAIFSGELRLRNTTVNTSTTSRQVLVGETTGLDSAVVRRREATFLAFGDSTDSQITMHGLVSKGDISSTTKVTTPNITLTGLAAQTGEVTALTINGTNIVGTNEMVDVASAQTITGSKSIDNAVALGFIDNGSGSTNTVTRASNNTWRFSYSDASIIFDAANNNTFEVRNNNDSAILQMDPNGGTGSSSRLNLMGDIKVETLAATAVEGTSVMVDPAGVFLSRELSTSAFTDPGLDDVTAVDPVTTDQITTGGIVTTAPSVFGDSVRFNESIVSTVTFDDSVNINGRFNLPNIPSSTSLRVLVRNGTNEVAYQDITQEAFSGETLHTATSQGQATSNNVGAASFWVYDGTGFNDNDSLTEFVRVIDSGRDFYVQDKIFFNDNHLANPTIDPDRNFIRFTDPAFQGYPGIFDFISDDSDDPSSIGNALLRAGGLILTDSALVGGNLTITGNLTVNGTRTIINTTQLTVDDKTIVIADNAPDEVSTAGAGLYVTDSVNPFAKFTYDGAGSWVSNKNLTVDSDLIVSGATILDGNFGGDGGLSLLGAVELSTEATALMLGANDSVGYRELSSGAFTNIDNVNWNFVLSKGRFSGNEVPYIQSGFQIDSTGLVSDPGGTRIITLVGDKDSVGVSSIQSTAYEPLANFNLQFVTNRGATTNTLVTVNDLKITTAKDFDASINNTQLALHYDTTSDSVGYRDLGNLAYLDSDGETFKSITEKANSVNTTVANIKVNGLMIDSARAMSGVTVGMMYKSSTDSVGIRQLSDAAFLDPGLTEVLAQNDSTKLSATLGGLILPKHGTPVAGSPNVLDAGSADFFQMLIINQDNDSVSRGNIGTIVQTVSQETLQTVTNRGSALNGSSWDSTTVGVDLSGGLKLRNLTETTGDSVLIANANGLIQYRSLSAILAAQTLDDIVTAGPTTNKSIGIKDLFIYDGTGFADGTDAVATNHILTIDSARNAFFVDIDATGLTTLDSTTIDGTLTVNDSARVNEILTVTSSSDYPIRSVSTGRFAGIEFTDIFGTARFVYDGSTSKFDTLSTSLDVGGDLDVAGLTTLDSTTIDGTLTVSDSVSITGSASNLYVGNEVYINTNPQVSSNNASLQFGGAATSGPDYFIASIRTEDRSLSLEPNRLVFYTGDSVNVQAQRMYLNEDGAQINQNLNVDGITTLDSTTIDGELTVNGQAELGTGSKIRLDQSQISVTGNSLKLQAGSHFGDDRSRLLLGNNTNSSFGNNTSLGPDIQIYSGKGEIQFIGGNRPGQAGAVTIATMDSATFNVNGITTLDSTAIDAGAGGNGLTIPNLGEVTTNTDILTINGDVVSKTAFSDIYTVPPTPTLQSVTDAGNITDNFIRIRSTTSGGNVYLEVLDSGSNPDLGYHLVAGVTSFQQFETNEAGSSILNASTVIEAEDSDKTTMAIIRHGDTVGGPSLILAKNRGTNKLNKSAVTNNDNLGRIIFGGASNTTSTEEADPYTPSFEISADVSATVAYNDLASTMRWFSHDGGTKTQVMSLDANKMQLQTGVQLQDAAGSNLVIYDSADAVLWGNV